MATTQYIGARYVPLLYTNPDDSSNAWKSGVAYDPLTIVTDLNQSYTSKIPVPSSVGRPSENPAYWVLTGTYNAQVESYHQEVVALSGNVDTLRGRVDDIDEQLDRYLLIISDSYGMTVAGVRNSFVEYLEADGITDIFADWDYSAVGGAGFGAVSGQESFYDILNAYNDADMIAKVTDIMVVGGTNDAKLGFYTEAMAGITNFCNLADLKFPKLQKIHLFYCPHVALNTYNWPATVRTYNAYYTSRHPKLIFKNAINAFSWGKLLPDGVHPTTNGAVELAASIVNYFHTGSVLINTDIVDMKNAITTPEGSTLTYNATVQAISENEVLFTFIVICGNYPSPYFNLSKFLPLGNLAIGNTMLYDKGDNTAKSAWAQLRNTGVFEFTAQETLAGRYDAAIVEQHIFQNYNVGVWGS